MTRLAIRWFAMLCLPAILAASCSYAFALRGSGNTSLVERSVEWLRGHHYGDAVSRIENMYYSHNQPSSGGTLAGGVPAASSNGTAVTGPTTSPSAANGIPPLATQPLPNEGVWQPLGDSAQGMAAMQVAYLRPDDIHGSVLAAVVRIDQSRAAFRIVPGSDEPGHGPWTGGSSVPAADMTNLIAAFNSGFRIADARGGFMKAGKTVGTLRDGGASLVLSADGHLGVDAWGRDVTAADHPLVVRQNLDLIVDGSQPVPGLDDNTANRWGHTVGNKLYVWRSGVGIDSA